MMQDPTADEMRAFLAASPFASEFDEFDREEAIYWFANDWHGGQWSNLYSALSTSSYHPGAAMSGVDVESGAGLLYDEMVAEYGSPDDKAANGQDRDAKAVR